MGVIGTASQWLRDLLLPPITVTMLGEPVGHRFDSLPRPVDQLISDMMATGWGARVTRQMALSVPAILRGRNELCSIASLPLRQYRGLDIVPAPLLAQIDPDVANVVTLAQTIEDLVFETVAWWEVLGRDSSGFPVSPGASTPAG